MEPPVGVDQVGAGRRGREGFRDALQLLQRRHGPHFDVRSPLTVPRSLQGRPVVLQAGWSGHGRDFAARWAELVFTGDPGIEVARGHYAEQKARIAEFGRDPASVRICPMAYPLRSLRPPRIVVRRSSLRQRRPECPAAAGHARMPLAYFRGRFGRLSVHGIDA
ncbi:LLM class flavin-dependent oxidoreductase [Streptomyces geranii]|uniref:LLM class flavin-dependent oxidoreductase n=1 Tax=Streptomyces geranii TaxID=2058923 RepID=UPI001E2D1C19|nr:LLM class flavin-dependent oxidoreductase [Streptomyces geranii]